MARFLCLRTDPEVHNTGLNQRRVSHSPRCAKVKVCSGWGATDREGEERGVASGPIHNPTVFHSTPGRCLSLQRLSAPLCQCYFKTSMPMDRSIHTQANSKHWARTLPTAVQRGRDERCANSTVFWDTLFQTSLQRVFAGLKRQRAKSGFNVK